jgi:flagellar basal-body rod protein FlgB
MIERTNTRGDLADRTMQAVEYALSGLAARADVRANNIANAETPGFKASRLDFESELRNALRDGDVDDVGTFSKSLANTIPDAFGNTVNLELETTEMTKDNLMVQALVNGYNYKVGLLRTAIGGGAR